MNPRYVVLLGAARSGTKILRDSLATATGAGAVPYDIGYVWRFGNEDAPDDTIAAADVTVKNRTFIRRFVNRYAAGQPSVVIEKTVGNTLRVPFVSRVLDEALYVHVLRDGVDVIESTRRQWTAPSDLRYLVRKARHFPLRLAPSYGTKYLRSLTHRRSDSRVGTWGPRYPGIDRDLAECDLLTVCSRQWRRSVEYATADLQRLSLPVVEVRYERFVAEPAAELQRLAEFAGLAVNRSSLAMAARTVVRDRAGTGRSALETDELTTIDVEVGSLLDQLGYARPSRSAS